MANLDEQFIAKLPNLDFDVSDGNGSTTTVTVTPDGRVPIFTQPPPTGPGDSGGSEPNGGPAPHGAHRSGSEEGLSDKTIHELLKDLPAGKKVTLHLSTTVTVTKRPRR